MTTPTDPQSAVLDANVLYPASLRDTLLRAAFAGLFVAHWSDQILAELARNLVANGEMTETGVQRLYGRMRVAFPKARITGHEPRIVAMTNAVEDRHILAAAVHARAGYIVTANLRDFPAQVLRAHDVIAVSPDVFLAQLYAASGEQMAHIVVAQAKALHSPPRTVAATLDALAVHVPTFAALVRSHLAR